MMPYYVLTRFPLINQLVGKNQNWEGEIEREANFGNKGSITGPQNITQCVMHSASIFLRQLVKEMKKAMSPI